MLKRLKYVRAMKVAYLFNRPSKAASEWNADRVFIDAPGTSRLSRSDMIDNGGLRAGDTLCVIRADIGRGREIPMILDRLESMGVAVELMAEPDKPRKKAGRASKLNLSEADRQHIRKLWHSTVDRQHVLKVAAEKAGVEEVTVNQLNYAFGPRNKAQKEQN